MAKQKIRFDVPNGRFPFVPPVSELMGWLNGPKETYTILHWIQNDEKLGLQNKLDLKTLRKACRDGVTPRIAGMIEANIHQAARAKSYKELLEGVVSSEPVVNGTNGTKWLSGAQGFLQSINRYQITKLELPRTFAFLKLRAEAESQLVLAFHNARSMDAPIEQKLKLVRTAFSKTCRHHTLLKSQEIQDYGTAIIETNGIEQPRSLKLVADAFKLTFSLRMDFYHQLLANFMADMLPLRKMLNLTATLDDTLIKHGAMGQLMPMLKQGELVTPTRQIYKLWCESFKSTDESLSYSAMAMYLMPPSPFRTKIGRDNDQHDIEDSANETRCRRLNEWRSGTIPYTDQLTTFLESITGKTCDAFLPFIMTRVATVWTKWIEQELTSLDQLIQETPTLAEHLDREWFLARFSQYPEYWRYAKAQAALNTA